MANNGINRTVSIPQPNIFGRIGTGIGKGISEALPKEIERGRLQQGLKQLGEQKDLTPLQQFSALASLPGATPQIIQSGTDLLRQQARAQALSQQNQNKPTTFPKIQPSPAGGEGSKVPSLTKEDVFGKAQEGNIPPTIEERDAIASDAFDKNPAYFNNDPQKAIEWANEKIGQEQKIAEAYQAKHANLTHIQDNVVKRLDDQFKRLNGGNPRVPSDLYSKIEDQAIQATKPKKDGGRGLTEQQAMKEYGDKLLDADRQFSKIDEIGNWGMTLRPSSESLRSLKNLQQEMEKLGQTDNMAKLLISRNGLSPMMSYAIAQPVNKIPNLNSFIKSLPKGNSTETIAETIYDKPGTLKIAPQLAEYVKNNENASPLSIAHELKKKGYDPAAWLEYIADHADELNLRKRQSEQASTPINLVTPWNDIWISSFTGIE